jgi:hypothetical protein
MKQLLWALPILFMVFTVSCKKSNSTPPKTNSDYLTQGSWKLSMATSNGADVTSSVPACKKDNIYTFSANLSGSMDEGATKCNSADPQTTSFTWSFTTSTVLHVTIPLFPGSGNDFTLVTLNDTQLVVTFVQSGQTIVATFVH